MSCVVWFVLDLQGSKVICTISSSLSIKYQIQQNNATCSSLAYIWFLSCIIFLVFLFLQQTEFSEMYNWWPHVIIVFVQNVKYRVSKIQTSISLSKLSTSWGQNYHAIFWSHDILCFTKKNNYTCLGVVYGSDVYVMWCISLWFAH